MPLTFPVSFWQQQNQNIVDPFAANVVLFLKADQSNLVTNTTTTANFTVPAVNSTVTISVVGSGFATANRAIRIGSGAGNYIITGIPSGTQLTIRNCGGTDNAAVGTVISSGATIALSILDSSINPKSLSAFGNAQISTVQSKHNGSSLLFDGTGDFLTTPATGDMLFASQAFTWEAWIYPTNLAATYRRTLMGNARANAEGDFGMSLQVKKNSTNQTMFSAWVNENGAIGSALNLNQWNHIACTRLGTSVEIFINGVKGTSGTCAATITSHTEFLIGRVFNNSGFSDDYTGYIDSLRLTAAIRYTANFNPETDTYLNV
jgi:hypothetical protein